MELDRTVPRLERNQLRDAAPARYPASADQENEWRLDDADPGISPKLTFDPADDIAAPYIATGVRPRVAILREQG